LMMRLKWARSNDHLKTFDLNKTSYGGALSFQAEAASRHCCNQRSHDMLTS
jgi:hypothetical protein